MEFSTLAPLRCGPRTVSVALLWIGMVGTVHWLMLTDSPFVGDGVHVPLFTIGSLYGFAGWGSWLAGGLRTAWARALTRGTLVLIMASAINQLVEESGSIRFVIYVGGLSVAQSALFFWLSFPDWQFSLPPSGQADSSSGLAETPARQYAIGELLIGTTAVAALLSIAIRYQPPIDPHEFWQVLAGIWIFFPILWAIACGAALHRKPVIAALLAFAALALLVVQAFVLGYWEFNVAGNPTPSLAFYASLYGVISLGSTLVFFGLTLAGRLDRSNVTAAAPPIADSELPATLPFGEGESAAGGSGRGKEREKN